MNRPRDIIKHTKAKILVSILELQVSRGYTNSQVVGHKCNYHMPHNMVIDTKYHKRFNCVFHMSQEKCTSQG